MARDNKDSVFTKVFEVFNNKIGALDCGFATMYRRNGQPYIRPYIRIANVNEEFKGKRAKKGDHQYDWKGSTWFVPVGETAAVLIQNFNLIMTGKATDIVLVQKSGDYMKQFTIGRGIFPHENAEDAAADKDLYINISTTDRDNQDWDDPISSVWFAFPKAAVKVGLKDGKTKSVNGNIELFRLFLQEATHVIMLGTSHAVHCVEFPRKRRRGGSEEDEDRPRRGPAPRTRGARGDSPKPKKSDDAEEVEEEEEENEETDDIPF